MRRLILAGLIALLPLAALARAPMETNQLVDGNGNPIGTADNPLVTSGGAASPTGSVTPAGTSGSQAQAVQGIAGGVPVAIQGGNASAVKTDGSATTQPVSAASLPLPTGASTAAAQATGNGSLASIDGKAPALVSGRVPVDGSAVTQPVSAAALPLPAGAATAANQATELASLATIAQRAVTYADASNQSVAANSVFNGTIRDLGTTPAYTRQNVAIFASQAGTAQLQACNDNGCGVAFVVSSQAVTAGSFATLSAPIYARYLRFTFQMSGTAGTVSASSSLTAN